MSNAEIAVVKVGITQLIDRFNQILMEGKEDKFSEPDVSSKFILPLLKILGWGIDNIDEVKEQRRTLSGPADYLLSIDRKPRLVVELKKFSENLDGYRVVRGRRETFPEQATRYAWHLKVEWVVLTNFKEIRLYNSLYKKPKNGLRLKIRYNQFYQALDRLMIISRDSVKSGELEKIERKAERTPIDKAVLEGLLEIRNLLSENVRLRNPSMTLASVREDVQKIIDRLIVVRVSEDRGIIGFESLHKELESWKSRGLPTPFMRSLKNIFRDFDDIYNTKLFELHSCEDLSIDNDILEKVIDILYVYNFDLISADILGAIYEDYLGHVLEETTTGGVQIGTSKKARKKKGIYYTPTQLVEFIVRKSLEKVLDKCQTPGEISRIKVVDPACGSGSFLIKAFDVFKEWYENYNRKLGSPDMKLDSHFEKVTDINYKILTENLFGVDIDPQAAEIASVNLMLKAIQRGEKLPQIMNQSIKVGNSLVSGLENGFDELPDEAKVGLKPFVWSDEFPDVFTDEGFFVVIGNPPYFKVRRSNPIRISSSFDAVKSGPVNIAMMFIHRAIDLTKRGGTIGLVLPKMLTYTKGWKGSRKAIFNTKIGTLIDCQKAFAGVLLEQVLLTHEKTRASNSHKYQVGEIEGLTIKVSQTRISQKLAEKTDFLFLEPSEIVFKIRQKALDGTVPLASICDIVLGAGIQSYSCWRKTRQSGDSEVLRGDDIQMWHMRDCLYFSPKSPEVQNHKRLIEKLRVPHLVAQRIVAHVRYPRPHIILMASYNASGAFAFNTVTNIILTDSNYNYNYVLGLLNSKLFSYFAHKFIYNNAVRSMDFYKDYAGRLPVKQLSRNEQRKIVKIVKSIIQHYAQPSRKSPEYQRYITESVVGYEFFNRYYSQLDPNDRDPKDIRTEGVVRNFRIVEDGEWLSFQVDYLDEAIHKIIVAHEVLRCRFRDRLIHHFLMNDTNSRGPSNRGVRLLDKILLTKVSKFNSVQTRNDKLIKQQLELYLKDYDAHQVWKKHYTHLDEELNKEIYSIYKLTETEINVVERDSRPTGWHRE